MMERMRLEDIKIPEAFKLTQPKEEKMCDCREFWRYDLKQDRPIVINHNNVLVDGYVMYLILWNIKKNMDMLENCIKRRKLKRNQSRTMELV